MTVPIISGDITTLISGGGLIMMTVVGYFLKKTYTKIDDTSDAVIELGKSFADKVEEIDENFSKKIDQLEFKLEAETKSTKTEIVQIFQDICHERQGSCGRLRDAKLDIITVATKNCCVKIQKVIDDRERKWDKQEQLNEQFKTHLYQTRDGGKSWDLRDDK